MADKIISDIVTDKTRWEIDNTLTYSAIGLAIRIPTGSILDSYRDYFDEKYLITVDVDSDFYYNPAGFAEKFYGSADLDFLVLYSSKIFSLYDFNKPKIKIWAQGCLNDINKLIIKKSDDTGMENASYYL